MGDLCWIVVMLRASFFVGNNCIIGAGTAFAVQVEGEERPIILTALHIFGPAGGLEEDVPAKELPSFVKWVFLYDLFEKSYLGSTNETLLLLGAEPMSVSGFFNPKYTVYGDLAAFYAQNNRKIATRRLSNDRLSAGEPIWLLASIIEGESAGKKLHKGYVVVADDEQLVFRYEDPNLNLQATSGAPILNQKGEVVGLNIAVRTSKGNLYGYANPAPSIRKFLNQALGD